MAVRAKRNGYEVYWRDPATGKQRGRYFRTKSEAVREDRRIKDLLRRDRAALLLEDAPSEAEDLEKHLLSTLFDRYISLNGSTMTEQDIGCMRFLSKRYGGTDVRAVSIETYIDMYEWLRGRGWKVQSVPTVYRVFNRVLRFALDLGLISALPKRFKVPPYRYKEFVPPSQEELSRLYEAANPRLKRVIVLGAGFGMRVGVCELFSLKWSDVDFDHWVIRLRAAKKNKSVQVRTLPIPEFYRRLFSDWHAEDGEGCEYVVHCRGKAVKSVQVGWKRLLRLAGMTRWIRPYDLRHAFATNMLEKGVDIGTVAKLMGHSGTEMVTRHYQYVRETRKMDALSSLDPIVCPRGMDRK